MCNNYYISYILQEITQLLVLTFRRLLAEVGFDLIFFVVQTVGMDRGNKKRLHPSIWTVLSKLFGSKCSEHIMNRPSVLKLAL